MNEKTMPIGRPWARRQSRRLLVQALYQWSMTGQSAHHISAQYLTDNDPYKFDSEYFEELLQDIIDQFEELCETIRPELDRAVSDLDPIERSILALSCYELLKRIDVPYKVVLNEGVELAKIFGATDSHKYVNGVLEKIAIKGRSVEFASHKNLNS